MTFTVTHARAFSGTDIKVVVGCAGDEGLRFVTVKLDDWPLEDLELPSGTDQYERTFLGAGSAGPGTDHTINVTIMTDDDEPHASVTSWTDAI